MVVPDSLALVVRQRGGPNLIIHTRGLPGNVVNRACEEAVTIMGRFAVGRGQTDVDGSGHIHPKFSHDRLLVMDGRYSVVYRLVFKVWVMAVAPCMASTFLSVRLVESATKGLVSTCQILEVDQDVIMRNYPEAHFMLGAVLNHQGANLQKAQVEALANIYSMIADSKDKKKGGGADGAKRSSVNINCPTLRDFGGPKEAFNFEIPSDFKKLKFSPTTTFPPPMTSTSPKATPVVTPPQPSFNLDDLIPKPMQTPSVAPSGPVQELDPFNDFFSATPAPQSVSTDPFQMGSPVIAMGDKQPVAEVSWFAFNPKTETKATPVGGETPRGPLLYHMERWEGSFKGKKCISSKAWGEVNLRKEVWKMHSGKHLGFKFLSGVNYTSRCLMYSMKCSKLNMSRGQVSNEEPGAFQIKIQPSKTPLLTYNLLNGCFQIPIKVNATLGSSIYKEQESIVVLIHLLTNPQNPSPATGSVLAWIPLTLGSPSYVRPCPQFSRKQNCLRWRFSDLQPNKTALFKFVFINKDSVENQEELAQSIRIEINAIGTPGSTFTGLSLAQESAPMTKQLSPTPSVCTWTATVTAKP
eukprot:g32.t1